MDILNMTIQEMAYNLICKILSRIHPKHEEHLLDKETRRCIGKEKEYIKSIGGRSLEHIKSVEGYRYACLPWDGVLIIYNEDTGVCICMLIEYKCKVGSGIYEGWGLIVEQTKLDAFKEICENEELRKLGVIVRAMQVYEFEKDTGPFKAGEIVGINFDKLCELPAEVQKPGKWKLGKKYKDGIMIHVKYWKDHRDILGEING